MRFLYRVRKTIVVCLMLMLGLYGCAKQPSEIESKASNQELNSASYKEPNTELSKAFSNTSKKAFNNKSVSSARLITVDGSITEIIYALGAESELVGVDTTSVYPLAATQLPKVGYIRHLNTEGLLSLNPDVLITTDGAGPAVVIEQVQQAGLRVEVVKDEKTLEGALNKIEKVGQLTGKQPQAKALMAKIETKVKAIQARIKQSTKQPPRVLFLLAAGNHGVMAAGLNSSGNDMINLLDAQNVSTSFSSYKPLTAEGVVSSKPDVIVVATAGKINIEGIPQLKMAKNVVGDRIVIADSSLLLGFGPRLGEAVELLAKALYPALEQ